MIADRGNRMKSARAFRLFRRKRGLLPLPKKCTIIEGKARETANKASNFATNDPEPGASELYTEILL
ncbi:MULTISPECIES: hypothetical protein [Sinorhizobium/Ensifer group]|uniref:hypothetical protein n=1 Tax=Sinorhizobium sp. M4_45 TaxID=2037901 RepID=UPI000C9A275C|nr:hypothetical protein CN934_31095 [Ensifer sp. MMN_5]PND24910.1 hypothetical protein CN933_24655 [Sinorhizobium sp. M4_45]